MKTTVRCFCCRRVVDKSTTEYSDLKWLLPKKFANKWFYGEAVYICRKHIYERFPEKIDGEVFIYADGSPVFTRKMRVVYQFGWIRRYDWPHDLIWSEHGRTLYFNLTVTRAAARVLIQRRKEARKRVLSWEKERQLRKLRRAHNRRAKECRSLLQKTKVALLQSDHAALQSLAEEFTRLTSSLD